MTIDWEKLHFRSDVRLLSAVAGQLRLRKGLWNYEEALLSFDDNNQSEGQLLAQLFDALLSEVSPSIELCQKLQENQPAMLLLEQLINADFIQQQQFDGEAMARLLLGNDRSAACSQTSKEALLVCDCQQLCGSLQQQSRQLGIELISLDGSLRQQLSREDLSAKVDGWKEECIWQQLEQQLQSFRIIVVVLQQLNINLLRNLNQLLLRRKEPGYLILTYIDGPFTGLTVLKPGESACFGCLEQRIMARLQDHHLYQRFVSEGRQIELKGEAKPLPFVPLMQWLSGLLLGELVTLSRLGVVKLLGRMLHFYLPTYEIQYQNILRSANCPCCGYALRSQLHELNVCADRVLDEIRSDPDGVG